MTAAALSSAETDLVSGDKPVLISSNVVENSSSGVWYTTATANITSTTDLAATDFPSNRAYDRWIHSVTKPNAAAATYYLGFDLSATTANYDCAVIGGHNFSGLGITCTIEIADANTFNSQLHTIATFLPTSTGKRLVTYDLHHTGSDPMRYTVDTTTPIGRYARLKIVKASGTFVPEIGEFWLGRRRHLPFKFEETLDDKRTESRIADFESRSGVNTRYTFHRGQARRTGSTLVDGAANISTVDSWWSECNQGTKSFLFCENPSTDPQATQLMHHLGGLDFPLVTASARQLSLEMREVYPFTATE